MVLYELIRGFRILEGSRRWRRAGDGVGVSRDVEVDGAAIDDGEAKVGDSMAMIFKQAIVACDYSKTLRFLHNTNYIRLGFSHPPPSASLPRAIYS